MEKQVSSGLAIIKKNADPMKFVTKTLENHQQQTRYFFKKKINRGMVEAINRKNAPDKPKIACLSDNKNRKR